MIAHGFKNIENRTWKTSFRGRILIHAGLDRKLRPALNREQHKALYPYYMRADTQPKPYGSIIGSVEIVDCVINHPSIWAEKSNWYGQNIPAVHGTKHRHKEDDPIYNWVLANPILFEKPIPAKGSLSLWEFDENLLGE